MRRIPAACAAWLLALSACSEGGLPPAYRALEIPAVRLDSAEAAARGREIYLLHCALCHGESGDGHGVRRALSSRPRDLTDATWQRRTGSRELFFVIREGLQGTGMPAWKNLDDEETWDLVAFLRSLSEEDS